MWHVQCKNCGRWDVVSPGHPAMRPRAGGGTELHDPHAAVDRAGCTCCPEDHDHAAATRESGNACRPVTITAMASTVLTEG